VSINPRMFRSCLIIAMALGSTNGFAQSSDGSIYGLADPGSKIIIKNEESGLTREYTVGEDGKFNCNALPTGTYTVSKAGMGGKPVSQTARVNAGVGTAVTFVELEEVVVLGTAITPIDTSTSHVSTTYSASQLRELPINQNIIDVAMLAPGISRGASAVDSSPKQPYNQLASFGGASIAENQYYVNGFNVTNLFRNIEYSQVPFYAIDSEQLLTGGYGPEFGLSTGGVINLTTMRGTNTWKTGGAVNWSPDSLRATMGRRTYASDGDAYREYGSNSDSLTRYDLWAGGPIIQDKLFVYGIVEVSKGNITSYPNSYEAERNIWDEQTQKPFGLLKMDWNINDRNIIELTGIKNEVKYTTPQYLRAEDAQGFAQKGAYAGTDINKRGGWIGTGKYTGYFTDQLTFAAQYGQLNSKRSERQYAADGSLISYNGMIGDYNQPGCPYVVYAASWQTAHKTSAQPTCYITSQVDASTGEDTRKAGRLDFDYKVPAQLLGAHTLKAGYSWDKWNSFYGASYSGGTYYTYYTTAALGEYVRVRHFQTGADAGVEGKAYYFKDDWQLSNNLLAQIGVRNDSFSNLNGDGEKYLKQDNIWQPRIGIAWDPSGNSTKKLYGSFGIYSLPVTAGISIRGASASLYTTQLFRYTAIDPATGAATLGPALGPQTFLNGEDGHVPAAGTFTATNLDPTKQEEFIVGYQQDLFGRWRGGVRATYRNLQKTIDDFCDARPFDRWAARTGFEGGTGNIDNLIPCFVINPGYGADLSYDLDGDGSLDNVQLTPQDIGLPKAKRRYISLDVTLEKAWSNSWYAQFSYTWGHNYGNAEGLADSDNAQLDIGTTLAFDYPELVVGSYGNLPNDHRNTFKALGAYRPFADWMISGNVFLQSGKPKNCIGLNNDDYGGYGAAYFFCNDTVVPRGSLGTTDTLFQLDMGVTYSPSFLQGFSAMASVYNVLNRHGVSNIDEYNTDSQGSALSSYGAPYTFQTPRFVQLTARYDFGLKR